MGKRTPELQRDEQMPADVSARGGWGRPRQSADLAIAKIPTRRITINLDQDIVAVFKAQALRGGLPYQVAINQALRQYLHDRETQGGGSFLESLMAALDNPAVRQKIRVIRAVRSNHHEEPRTSSAPASSRPS